MDEKQRELLDGMRDSVLEMEEDDVSDLCSEYVEEGYDPLVGISDGLAPGMNRAGELYEEGEYYIPELLLCSDAMYAGIDVLRPHIPAHSDGGDRKPVAVVGVVEGDTHDIGKNLFKIMLETEGFEVYDLGRDVPSDAFIEKVSETHADLLGMSTLMTTTMDNMRVVIEKLKEAGLRSDVVVMVGGGPISLRFANMIGADAYEADASTAAKTARRLVAAKRG